MKRFLASIEATRKSTAKEPEELFGPGLFQLGTLLENNRPKTSLFDPVAQINLKNAPCLNRIYGMQIFKSKKERLAEATRKKLEKERENHRKPEDVGAEYGKLAAEAGDKQYRIDVDKMELREINKRMHLLNREYEASVRIHGQPKLPEAEKAIPAEALANQKALQEHVANQSKADLEVAAEAMAQFAKNEVPEATDEAQPVQ